MISFVRIALIMLIIYLVQRAFFSKSSASGSNGENIKIKNPPENKKNKVPKEIGEYIDYEETDK
jgi:hypothetical protein